MRPPAAFGKVRVARAGSHRRPSAEMLTSSYALRLEQAKPYRDVELGHPSSDPLSRPSARPSSFDDDSDARDAGPEGWEREQQHALLDRQDRTLASLEGTLGTIGGQARLMGQEVNEQNE